MLIKTKYLCEYKNKKGKSIEINGEISFVSFFAD